MVEPDPTLGLNGFPLSVFSVKPPNRPKSCITIKTCLLFRDSMQALTILIIKHTKKKNLQHKTITTFYCLLE